MGEPCDALRLELAEALTGERPMSEALREHAASCGECSALASALRELAAGPAPAQDDPHWRAFESSLRRRIEAADGARAARPRAWLLAAAVVVGALALFTLKLRGPADPLPEAVADRRTPVSPEGPEPAAGSVLDEQAVVLAAASADGLDAGLRSLGLEAAGDDEPPLGDEAAPAPGPSPSLPPPSWGDAVNELGDELSALDAAAQADLARALREAT